jgi:hypothetical protein
MVNIYYDLKCTWQKVRSISKGMSLWLNGRFLAVVVNI